jgi:hypothetical protein
MTGTGWYMHFPRGVTPFVELDLTMLPPHQDIIFSTRYPSWVTLKITRNIKFFAGLTGPLTKVSSRREVILGDGTLYHFAGTTLTIKLVDPGTCSAFHAPLLRVIISWQILSLEIMLMMSMAGALRRIPIAVGR